MNIYELMSVISFTIQIIMFYEYIQSKDDDNLIY